MAVSDHPWHLKALDRRFRRLAACNDLPETSAVVASPPRPHRTDLTALLSVQRHDGVMTTEANGAPHRPRTRMSGQQRREQLLDIGRSLFAEKGFDATSVEEIAATAGVSKPVVYEHFGGKEGLYAVVVDREVKRLLDAIAGSLIGNHPREVLERVGLALLTYVEDNADGFRILVRDSPVATSTGTFASLISDVATQVEHLLVDQFRQRGFEPSYAPMYAQMLVGSVALVGQWWLDVREPSKDEVVANLVNLAWNGLSGLEQAPTLITTGRTR